MVYFLKKFKLLFLFFVITFIFLEEYKLYANYIRDTELEVALDSWAKPIFEAANINPKEINKCGYNLDYIPDRHLTVVDQLTCLF